MSKIYKKKSRVRIICIGRYDVIEICMRHDLNIKINTFLFNINNIVFEIRVDLANKINKL